MRADENRLHAVRMQSKGDQVAQSYIPTSIHEAAPVNSSIGFGSHGSLSMSELRFRVTILVKSNCPTNESIGAKFPLIIWISEWVFQPLKLNHAK